MAYTFLAHVELLARQSALPLYQMDAINAATLREFHNADDVDGVDVQDPYDPNEELPFDISREGTSNATENNNGDDG